MTHLAGRRILVTGAARGIGRSISLVAAAAGASVAVTDIDADGADATAALIHDAGGSACSIEADVTSRESCVDLVERAGVQMGGLDGLVNNAGILREQPIGEIGEAEWEQTLAVNLTAPWRLTQLVLPWMVQAGGGAIVNISSIEGMRVRPKHAAYAAAKGGLLQLTRTTAVELGDRSIRANAVCPGSIDTEMMQDHVSTLDDPAAALDDLISRNRLGRLGEPDEVARVVVHLLSDESSFTSGHAYVVDGARIVGT